MMVLRLVSFALRWQLGAKLRHQTGVGWNLSFSEQPVNQGLSSMAYVRVFPRPLCSALFPFFRQETRWCGVWAMISLSNSNQLFFLPSSLSFLIYVWWLTYLFSMACVGPCFDWFYWSFFCFFFLRTPTSCLY